MMQWFAGQDKCPEVQFRRYPRSQVILFDKGLSARAAVLGMGGAHHRLGIGGGGGEDLAFQPLARIDGPAERAWAADWLSALLAGENVAVTPEVRDQLWSAWGSLASAPIEERTITGLTLLLQSQALRLALAPYTLDGPYGKLLDADRSIVVVDNLGSHKGSRVRKLLKAAGIRLFFLPPYSPDLNPIEEMFAKLKRLLRKANKRTIEATWRRIGKLLDHFPPSECANYIRGAGYASI